MLRSEPQKQCEAETKKTFLSTILSLFLFIQLFMVLLQQIKNALFIPISIQV